MTTTIPSTNIVVSVEPLFTEVERSALAGFLAGYRGLTRDAYSLDLRMFTARCQQRGLHLFQARRADIECFGRDMETRGRARATIARRLCTIAEFYRYAVEEELLDHSPPSMYAVHGWTTSPTPSPSIATRSARCSSGRARRTERARADLPAAHQRLRVSEALGADIDKLRLERGHRTLTLLRKGGKIVTIPLAPRTARAIDLPSHRGTARRTDLPAPGRCTHGPPLRQPDRAPRCPPRRRRQAHRPAYLAARIHYRRARCGRLLA